MLHKFVEDEKLNRKFTSDLHAKYRKTTTEHASKLNPADSKEPHPYSDSHA